MSDALVAAGLIALLAGGVLIGAGLALRYAPRPAPAPDLLDHQLTFEEVCLAVAAAKTDRRVEENLTRDYVDGADGVLAELMERGYGETPHELQTAYLAGGEEPEVGVDTEVDDET